MGMSSSQGRLLSITARLTSNEYESQQISNAKMRLATQSEDASANYIAALNSKQLTYQTYDAKGQTENARLTAGALYQYSDMKNQYSIVNATGQVLLPQEDVHKFQQAKNLDEFLQAYGLKKQWKSTTLESNYEKLQSSEFQALKAAWDAAVQDRKQGTYIIKDENDVEHEYSSDRAWELEKSDSYDEYLNALADYDKASLKYANGLEVDFTPFVEALSAAKAKYSACITYDNWLNTMATYNDDGSFTEEYLNMQEYNAVLAEFNAEAEDFGNTIEDLYVYDDATKAQWYTNLWYRLNGESSNKSAEGNNATNYSTIDSKLLNSTSWLQDALTQGVISIETASYKESPNIIPDASTPTIVNLAGIKWTPTIYTSCIDISQKDDDQAIARAEAEYERKTKEIDEKDQKYQNKIKMLDTEHTALQTEYESVQSAMNKNIDRSFKAFS